MVNSAFGNCERGSRTKAEGLLPRRTLFPGLFWDLICASCVRHLHSTSKACVFLLDTRTQLWNPDWSVHPDSGHGLCLALLLSQIESTVRARHCVQMVCPERVLGKGCSIDMCVLALIYRFF